MSGVGKYVGTIAGVVSIAMMFVPGGQIVAGIATAATIARAATAVAAGAALLTAATQKKPPAKGQVSQVQIGANLPMPYMMGRTQTGGNLEYDIGYGGSVGGVKNPYSSSVLIWSLGPIQGIEAFQCDFATVNFGGGGAATGYYAGYMHLASQLGACPEAAALSGPWGAIPGWTAAHKLSGLAASLWSNKFDKKGKIYAAGLPQPGIVGTGVYVYDARQDSTYPGGSGACRPKIEATYVGGAASKNPSCHAVTYAMARYHNGVKVFGPGYAPDAIDWPAWVQFANVCDANGWEISGLIYEGPGISRWDNLRRICAAGAAEPCDVGGKLSVRYSAPKVAVDTIMAEDLAQGEIRVVGMKTWRARLNAIVPKYRSEANRWEYVQSAEVSVPAYVTEDGEEKSEERTYELVADKDQAAQLAAYELVNGRELGPWVVPLKPRLIDYGIGECLEGGADLPKALAGRLMEITDRAFDPKTGVLLLTLETETTAKHPFALGQTGTAPPTPTLITGQDVDDAVSSAAQQPALTVASEAAQVALEVPPGTTVFRSDLNQSFSHNGGTAGTIADWTMTGVTTGATAATTSFTPTGGIAATNVQAMGAELDTEKASLNASVTFAAITGTGLFRPQAGLLNSGTVAVRIENTGVSIPAGAAGPGMELFTSAGISYVQTYDRTALAYGAQRFRASTHDFQISTTTRLTVSTSGADATGRMTATTYIKGGSFTIATLPSAAAAGAHAQCLASNGRKAGEGVGAGTGIPVWCDGTSWRTFYDNTVAAA